MRRWRFYGSSHAAGVRAVRPAQRSPDRVDGHDAAQHAVAVHGHHGAEAAEPLVAQQLLERVLEAGAQAARRHRRGPSPTRSRGRVAGGLRHAAHGLARHHAHEPPARVDHRKPGPAVAQEELALGAVERQVGRGSRPARRPSRRPRAGARCVRRTPPAPRPSGRPGRGRCR